MPLDPARVAEARAWLRKAELDLRAAEHERKADPPLTADIAFHAQQLAEKSLKALLSWHDKAFRKTHNLVELGRECLNFVPELEEMLRRAAVLTEYAWKFRYPGEPEEPSVEESDEALALARQVYEAVLSHVPEEVRRHEER